jgi:hypothetical protein
VGERTADALVKEHEPERRLVALLRQSIGVPLAVALHQTMGFHLAEIVSELGDGVGFGLQPEGELASWISAMRQPLILVPPWRSTSIRRRGH